jgi:AcrR family transcriptional regulator
MKRSDTTSSARRTASAKANTRVVAPDERYDANIEHILRAAAVVFAGKSFGIASIRDIAAQARISFPRIYYYLRNKEELLYLISKRAFERLIETAQARAASANDAEEGLRLFIEGHIEYHINNLSEMKVLAREADSLSGRYAAHIARLRSEYSRLGRKFVERVAEKYGRTLDREDSRIATSLMFGAMNWLYTWYEPPRDYEQRRRIMDEIHRMVSAALTPR